jgi:hypothetical protein
VSHPSRLFHRLAARLPSLLLFAGDLARVKQTARRRRRYVTMPTSSSSAAAAPSADASSEETLSTLAAEELRAGDTVDFGVSRMSSVRVQDMQQLGYCNALNLGADFFFFFSLTKFRRYSFLFPFLLSKP